MLQTRLWMGGLLIVVAVAILWIDHHYHGMLPLFGLLVAGVALVAMVELRALLPGIMQPHILLSIFAVEAMLCGNWVLAHMPFFQGIRSSWECIAYLLVGIMAVAFLFEMAFFHGPGNVIARMCGLAFLTIYLGLLPAFLIELRWRSVALRDSLGLDRESFGAQAALWLAIFGPKIADIAAYFTGRYYGQRPLAPVLSPKKTLEGAVGGIAAAALFATIIALITPITKGGVGSAFLLGAAIGVVSLFGDLVESLIKRDAGIKDASGALPGFGGVLDVVDSILFCGPLVYWWLSPDK